MAVSFGTLEEKQNALGNTLGSSNTYYSRDPIPYKTDLSNSLKQDAITKQINALKSKQLGNQWYGKEDLTKNLPGETPVKSQGTLLNIINTLQKPLNTVVGAIQYGLGKGTESSLVANMQKAADTGLVTGDVLQQLGAPRWISAPLGFMGDIALDPINAITLGTGAILPRTGIGLVKGSLEGGIKQGLEAAGVGITSNLAKKAALTMDIVPFAKKWAKVVVDPEATGVLIESAETLAAKAAKNSAFKKALITGSTKYADIAANLSKKAIAGSAKYDTLIGEDVWNRVNKNWWGGLAGKKLGVAGVVGENYRKRHK